MKEAREIIRSTHLFIPPIVTRVTHNSDVRRCGHERSCAP